MLSVAAALATVLLGTGATPPSGTADISVDLDSPYSLVLGGARFDVSITNHGPDPLTTATVVVELGHDGGPLSATPCAFDAGADTLTCTFGALPVGATATKSVHVYFALGDGTGVFSNTATATTSTPADPDSTDDTDTVGCYYQGGLFPAAGPSLVC